MNKRVFGLSGTILALALGACGGGGGGGAMEPGEWETTAELTKVDIANLPEDIRRTMRMPASRTTTTRGCWTLTADRIRIENLRFTIPEPLARGAGCTLPEVVLEGGTLRGRMSCTGFPAPPTTGAQTMSVSGELDGSYTPNSLQATTRGEVRFGERSGSGEVRITSRRIGACPPPPRYSPPYIPRTPDDPDALGSDRPVRVMPVPDAGQEAREAVNAAATAR